LLVVPTEMWTDRLLPTARHCIPTRLLDVSVNYTTKAIHARAHIYGTLLLF